MNDKTQDLRKRSMQFALRVVRLFRSLPSSAETRVVGQQLLRSATSVAANYRAACKARSRADFVSKLGIVEEEVDESVFWLEFLVEAQMMSQQRMSDLIDEAKQLAAIFAASRLTAKRNNRQSEVGNRKSGGRIRP
ncbi:MAG: four helix bundle protein [Candidatus Sulfotelmatobacter sp.]